MALIQIKNEFIFIFCTVTICIGFICCCSSVKRELFLFRGHEQESLSILTGLAMLSQSIVSIIGLSSPSHVQAESQQSNQNSDTTVYPLAFSRIRTESR